MTYPGLQMLTGKEEIFEDAPAETTLGVYRQGAAARAESNGDVDGSAPERWSYGAGDGVHTLHGVLTLASDDDEELIHVIEAQKKTIAQAAGTVVFHQRGAVLPGDALQGLLRCWTGTCTTCGRPLTGSRT
ncbi:hypothetical protein [Streptomyces sp. NPDC053542]|uniref:hypothetical protein n=1 Tax=Streptomyces sp. NPDC053542 TaxID=3365710 RepID=UPI0037D91F4C